MVVFGYLWFIFRDFPLKCISKRLNRYLSNLLLMRIKTRSGRFVKVMTTLEGEVLLLKMSLVYYRSLSREALMPATVSVSAEEGVKNMVHSGASLLLSRCPISTEAGDRKIRVMELAVDSRPLPSRLSGEETTTKDCVGV